MKKSRFTESQIIAILKQHESGLKVGDICREKGISQATFFNWKAKYGVMSSNQLKRLKELEKENSQLKRMYADMSLINTALKDAMEKKLYGLLKNGRSSHIWLINTHPLDFGCVTIGSGI